MAISLTIKFPNNRIIVRNIRAINEKLEKRKKLNTRIGIKALAEIEKQFKTDGKNFETPWKDLSPTTKQRRRKGRMPGGIKILRDTGALKNSFTYKADNTKVVIGTSVKYAKYHQFGTKRNGKRTLPKRPQLPDKDKIAIEKISKPIVDDYIKNKIEKTFGR